MNFRFCADCRAVRRRETVRKNNLKRRDAKLAWYQAHREENIAKAVEWGRNHPEARKATVRKHRETKEFGRLMERDECAACGTKEKLVVHHADGNNGKHGKTLNNDPSNLVVLCRSCHASVHGRAGLKDWRVLLAV